MLGLQSPDLANVLVALIAGMGTWMATRAGAVAVKNRTSQPVPADAGLVEVAGALINDKKANEIIAAFQWHGEKLAENTHACNNMAHKLDPLAEVVRELAKEYEIASRMARR